MAEALITQGYLAPGDTMVRSGALVNSWQAPELVPLLGDVDSAAVIADVDSEAVQPRPIPYYGDADLLVSEILAEDPECTEPTEQIPGPIETLLGEVVVDVAAEVVSAESGMSAEPARNRQTITRPERAMVQTLELAQRLFGQPISRDEAAPFKRFMDRYALKLYYAERMASDHRRGAETACRMIRLHMMGRKTGEIKSQLNDDATTSYAHTRRKFVEILSNHIPPEQLRRGFEEYITQGQSQTLEEMLAAAKNQMSIRPVLSAMSDHESRDQQRLRRSLDQTLDLAQMVLGRPIAPEQAVQFGGFMSAHVLPFYYTARTVGRGKGGAGPEAICNMLCLYMDGWSQAEIKVHLKDSSRTPYGNTRMKFTVTLARHFPEGHLWKGFEEFLVRGESPLLQGELSVLRGLRVSAVVVPPLVEFHRDKVSIAEVASTAAAKIAPAQTAAREPLGAVNQPTRTRPEAAMSTTRTQTRVTQLLSHRQITEFYQEVGTELGVREWPELALCSIVEPPDAFYPESADNNDAPKRVCGHCAVKNECLEAALSNDDDEGIRGGFTAYERLELKRRLGSSAAA